MNPRLRTALIGALGVTLLTAIVLTGMGRSLWCDCGRWVPWAFDTWSSHNSQHLIDPYALSHFLHGVVFFGVLWPVLKDRPEVSLIVALGLEGAWEVLENSPIIIDRYRETAMALDYYGDSVANSVADLAACGLGWLATWRLPWWGGVVIFLLLELISLAWIRDSLILNVINLTFPIEAIQAWQAG